MARADILVAQTTGLVQFSGGGTEYIVETVGGVWYLIYVDTGSDLAFKKSSDKGKTWTTPTVLHAGTIIGFTCWYDRWSNIAAGLIHIAHCDSGTDDTIYRTIDTENSDTLSTATVVQNTLTSSVAGGSFSITRTRGGNVLLYGVIDSGAEGNFYRLPNANVPNGAWDAARGLPEAVAANDKMIMLPGFAADNQDAIGIFWDNSVNRISRYIHDDSANTWGETEFGAPDTFTGQAVTTAQPHFAAAVDLTNSRIIVVAWNAIDGANADLRCFTVTESAITAVTDVVANGTDDQGLCGIALDVNNANHWTVFYGGKSDGSETFLTSINIYKKETFDAGSTWGVETLVTTIAADITWLATVPRCIGPAPVAFHKDIALDEIYVNVEIPTAGGRLVNGGLAA